MSAVLALGARHIKILLVSTATMQEAKSTWAMFIRTQSKAAARWPLASNTHFFLFLRRSFVGDWRVALHYSRRGHDCAMDLWADEITKWNSSRNEFLVWWIFTSRHVYARNKHLRSSWQLHEPVYIENSWHTGEQQSGAWLLANLICLRWSKERRKRAAKSCQSTIDACDTHSTSTERIRCLAGQDGPLRPCQARNGFAWGTGGTSIWHHITYNAVF